MKFNLTQKIAYNAIFSAGARILDMALALVIIRMTTGYLGQSGFGDYTIVMAFVYIFSVIADMGLYSIVVREISREGADEKKIVNNAFTLRFFVGLLVFSFAYFASLAFPYSQSVKLGIAVAAFGFWVLSDIQVLMGLFQKHLAMDKVAIAEMAGRIVQIVFVWYFVSADKGFLSIILAVFLSAAANLAVILYFSAKYVRIKFEFDFPLWKKLIREAMPLAISAILVLIYFKLDTIFLSVMKPSSDVGIYGAAYKVMESLLFFPAMIVGLTMPIMSRCIFSDRDKFRQVVQRTLDFLIIMIVPVMIGTALVSEKIIRLIAPTGFNDAPLVLDMLMLALGFIFFGALFSNMMIAANRQKQLANIYLVGTVFNLATNFVFIPPYSYFGAAGTTVATELLVTALMLLDINKSLHFMPSFKVFYKSLFAALLMAVVLDQFSSWNIFYLVILALLIYFPLIYFSGAISKGEIDKLLNRKA